MLRTRLPLQCIVLPRRPFSTSRRVLDRPPSFTTPDPSPSPAPSPAPPVDPSKPPPPLPPTDHPIEDYASPLLHTASFFSTLFRYAVFGSVGIVSVTIGGLVGVHLWVEHVELAQPPPLGPEDDPDEWSAEVEGWSGAHTGRGGTDPRLGAFARAAVRGAWIASTWGAGAVGSPVGAAAPSSSPFGVSRPGGQMIGAQQAVASRGEVVTDAGWGLAEQYLVYALNRAAKKGISLLESADWEAQVEKGGVDRAAVELEERLAGLRERIGGKYKLEQARAGWERIYYALAASPTTDVRSEENRRTAEWEKREKVKASRKLGELSGRIAELWGRESPEGRQETSRAEGWFVGGLVPVLAQAERKKLDAPTLHELEKKAEEPRKHVSPSSSFFSFWSRSHPSSSPAPLNPEIEHLVSLLPPTSPTSPLSPATSRAVLASLISFETFLARTASDLPAAQAVQSSALNYANSLAVSSGSLPPLTISPTPPPTTLAQASKALTALYLTTRTAVLSTHLAECSLAHAQSLRSSSRALAAAREAALSSLHAARSSAQSAVAAFPAPSEKNAEALTFSKALTGPKVSKAIKETMEEQARRVRKDAERVDKIAGALVDLLERQNNAKK
ncbi:SPOSA6832_01290, partial [Sporobolomyces salmonicolor]